MNNPYGPQPDFPYKVVDVHVSKTGTHVNLILQMPNGSLRRVQLDAFIDASSWGAHVTIGDDAVPAVTFRRHRSE